MDFVHWGESEILVFENQTNTHVYIFILFEMYDRLKMQTMAMRMMSGNMLKKGLLKLYGKEMR